MNNICRELLPYFPVSFCVKCKLHDCISRVLDILTYWMKKCWPDIYRNPPVVSLHELVAYDHTMHFCLLHVSSFYQEPMSLSKAALQQVDVLLFLYTLNFCSHVNVHVLVHAPRVSIYKSGTGVLYIHTYVNGVHVYVSLSWRN